MDRVTELFEFPSVLRVVTKIPPLKEKHTVMTEFLDKGNPSLLSNSSGTKLEIQDCCCSMAELN